MKPFADSLAERIKSNPAFWTDVESVSASAVRQLLLGSRPTGDVPPVEIIARIMRSAVIFSQSSDEGDKGFAQDLALFSAVTSQDDSWRRVARDVLTDLGNHPGAERLQVEFKIQHAGFASFLRTALLRGLNKVFIGDTCVALTDFQQRVWSRLPQTNATAISAPTSAGKSFVVLEYLCQEAIRAPSFCAAFVAPTRALLGEVHGKVSQRLKAQGDIRVSTIPTLDAERRPKQLFILTQERLQVLLATWSGIFDLVVVDEAQAIGDQSRGMILQDCLEVVHQRNPATRLLFLSPGATGFEALNQAVAVSTIDVTETDLSPVVQNRIIVEAAVGDNHRLNLTLLSGRRSINVGTLTADRGFGNADTRLAAVALELGSRGGSLVYGTGPADAEKTAGQIASGRAPEKSEALPDLSAFVKKHVHPRYSLVSHVLKGVGFHYGKMPGLLREALEEAFKSGDLKFLVCTTTLFQGVNLPARNVFIDTPTRGRGAELDAASLWNFAGRAGRLGQDIVGNVFLVGYGSWETKPLSERARFHITPAFRKTITQHREAVLARLSDLAIEKEEKGTKQLSESAAGLLISRAARGTLDAFIARTLGDSISQTQKDELRKSASAAFEQLRLPPEAVAVNWTVNPFGQARLLKRFREKIKAGEADDLIPLHPSPWSQALYQRYVRLFSRLNREIFGKAAPQKFNNKLATISLAWMQGQPLPVIIDKTVKYVEEQNAGKVTNIDSAVRGVFEFVEDVLRFRYVQLGRAYVDLLRFALQEAGLHDQARGIYDFPLALELGVSSVAGQSFIELGLSRITASALEKLIPDSSTTVKKAREWLSGLTGIEFPLSRVIWDELSRKGLLAKVA